MALFLCWLAASARTHLAIGQTQADYQYAQRLEELFEQYDRAGQWQQAHEVAQQYLAYARQKRLMAEVQLAGCDSMARSLMQLGEYRQALEYFDQIIREADQVRSSTSQLRAMMIIMKGTALRFAAACHDRLGEANRAFELYQQSVDYFERQRLSLEAAEARTGLGWSLHSRGRDDEALARTPLRS